MDRPGPENTIRLSASDRGIRAAVALLKNGQQVAFPTETVYGLGADARRADAVAGIYRAKGRPHFNPLIVHVSETRLARQLAEFNTVVEALAEALWPGPLTLVLPRRADTALSDLVTAGLDTLALRVPAHDLARRLLSAFDGPLAAPSANPSGRISATTADHVMDNLGGQIAGVLDGGPTGIGLESTIVGLVDGKPRLLRPGGLSVEAIEAVLGAPLAEAKDTQVSAPGQLASHYAPKAQLVLNAEVADAGALWLAFGPLNGRRGLSLSEGRDLSVAAAQLFGHLHELDELARESGADRVLVDPVPKQGLGLAINDRLQRAAAPRDADVAVMPSR
ncbi:MAG: L-threonylcarbamoyladenylate synthase [Pseudomonadota bacterium]